MSCIEAVFITTSIQSSSAISLPSPSETIAFAALIPAGVAAFPSPMRFALMFSEIAAQASGDAAAFGKKRRITGRRSPERVSAAPHCSKSSVTAHQKQSPPAAEIQKRTASSAPVISDETASASPRIMHSSRGTAYKAIRIYENILDTLSGT